MKASAKVLLVVLVIGAVIWLCERFLPVERCDSEGFNPTTGERCK